jgi:hypothetical protein
MKASPSGLTRSGCTVTLSPAEVATERDSGALQLLVRGVHVRTITVCDVVSDATMISPALLAPALRH